MLSSVTPMMALTATVAAATVMSFERTTAFDGGILADNLARHHGAVLAPLLETAEAGGTIDTGNRADPDIRPFAAMHDWQSTVFENDGRLWLASYPANFPADGGRFGTEVMQRIPAWMEKADTAAHGYGLWEPLAASGASWQVTYPVAPPADAWWPAFGAFLSGFGAAGQTAAAPQGFQPLAAIGGGGSVAARNGAEPLVFDDPTVPQIGRAAPVIVTRIDLP